MRRHRRPIQGKFFTKEGTSNDEYRSFQLVSVFLLY
jgi:hypothetical protein